MMEMPKLPKLSAQERLDAIYELNMRLFRGLIELNPCLTKDPNEVEIPHESQDFDFGSRNDG